MRRRLKLQVKPNVAPKAARGPGTSSQAEALEVKTEAEPKEAATDSETKVSAQVVEEEPKTEKPNIEKEVAPTSEVLDKTDVPKKDEKTVQAKPAPGSSRRSRIRPQVQIRGRGPSNANSTPAVSKPEQLETEIPSAGEAPAVVSKQDEEEADIQEVPAPSPAVKVLRIAKPAPVKKTARKEKKPEAVDIEPAPETKTEVQTISKSPIKDPQQAAARRSRFLKARPNLAEAGRARLRHPSMSQSDVVEESPRKAPPPVQRTAAALSSSATVGKNSETQHSVQKEGSLAAPSMKPDTKVDVVDGASAFHKPAAVHVDYPIVKSKHEAPTRKRRKVETVEEPIDRSKVTMKDLIYMNPSCNRMKSTVEEEERRWKEKERKGSKGGGVEVEHVEENVVVLEAMEDAVDGKGPKAEKEDAMDAENPDEEGDPEMAEGEGEEEGEGGAMPVPQVSIGPDGEIILNESSLVIQNKPEKTVDVHSPIIHERDGNFTYAYGRRRRTKLWNLKETKKFYVALSTIGTDFSLMEKFFPNRDRTDLKKKFKREEKSNRVLVDRALQERHNFDVSVFDEDSDKEDENKKEKKKRGRRASRKKPPAAEKKTASVSKRKTKSRYYSSESEKDEIVLGTPGSRKVQGTPVAKEVGGGEQQGTRTIRVIKRSQLSPRLNISQDVIEDGTPVMSTPARQTGASPGPLRSPGSATKSPGQFINLSKVNHSGNVNVNQMHAGQFVFVTSTPPATKEGQKPVQLIHVYRVSPSGVLNREPSPAGPSGAVSIPLHGINRPTVAGFSPATTFYGTPKPAQVLQEKGSPFITPLSVSRRQTPHAAVPSTSLQSPQIIHSQTSPEVQPVGNTGIKDSGNKLETPVFQKPEMPKERQAEGGQRKMMKFPALASPVCSDSFTRTIAPVASSTPLGQRTLAMDNSSLSQRTEAAITCSTSPETEKRTDATNTQSAPISQRTVTGLSRSPEVISLLDESPTRVLEKSPVHSPDCTTISANISVPVNAGHIDSESGNIVTDITHLVQSCLSSAEPSQAAMNFPLEGASPRLIQTLDVDIPPGIDPSRIISFSPQTFSHSDSPAIELPVVNVSSPRLVLDAEKSTATTSAQPLPPGGTTVKLSPHDHKIGEFGCSIVNNPRAQSESRQVVQDLAQQSVDISSPPSEMAQGAGPNPEEARSEPEGAGPESEGAGSVTVTMETQDSMETENQTIECEIVQSGDEENEDEGNYIVVEWLPGEEDSI